MKHRSATQLLAITLLLAGSVDEAAAWMPQKQIINLQQLQADGNAKAMPAPQQHPQQLMQQQKLSDKIIDLSAKVPEAAVLENKLTKMVKLEPQVQAALAKVNQVMKMPSKAQIEAVKQETKNAVKKVEKAVHQEETAKKRKEHEAEAATTTVAQTATANAPAAGLAQADQKALETVVQMKGLVKEQLKKQGLDVKNKDIQAEINAELKRQTEAMMAKQPESKKAKYDKMEKKRAPEEYKRLHAAVKWDLDKNGRGQGQALNPNVSNTYATSHDNAGERLTIADQGGLQIPGSVAQTSQRMCKAGEDEVFDNCVKPRDASNEDEDALAPPTPQQEGSRDYGNAAMEFVGKISDVLDSGMSDAELESQAGCVCLSQGANAADACACSCKKPKKKVEKPKPAPLPDAPKEVVEQPVEKVVEQAEEIVKEQREVIKEKEKEKPEPLVDVFSKALARNARIKQEQADNHASIMSMVRTRVAASTAVLDATRESLSSGLEFSKQITSQESRKSIEAQVELLASKKSAGKK